MKIHKPKPAQGWPKILAEFGMAVIALGGISRPRPDEYHCWLGA